MNCLVKKKTKAKEWFTIIAPKMFDEREIGKTMVAEGEALIGRRITLSLLEFTEDISKYHMKITFKIKRIEGNKAFADFDGSECLRDYISRMVLRRVRRIDTIQDLETKDKIKIRFKGLAIASKKINSNVEKMVRKRIEELIKEEVENSSLDELVKKIINNDIKNKILKEARKVYPIRNFEVRKTEVLQ